MTQAQARQLARAKGMTITRRVATNEYRVNLAGGSEATAYYTNDLADAVATMLAMHREDDPHCTCNDCLDYMEQHTV